MTRFPIWSVVVLCGAALPLRAQSLHYEGGISMATGTYVFTEPTTSWTLSSGLALSAGPLTIRATVPAFLQNTTLVAGSSVGLVPTGGSSSGVVADSAAARRGRGSGGRSLNPDVVGSASFSLVASETGGTIEIPSASESEFRAALGDPTFAVTVGAVRGARTNLSLSTMVKVPVTDTATFGTGRWDVGGSLSLSQRVSAATMVGMDLSFWHMGDLNDLPLRDPMGVSLSAVHLAGGGWGLSAFVSGARSVIEGFNNFYGLGAGVTKLTRAGSMGLSGTVGLSETAPDWSLGLQWRTNLLARR